MLQLPNFVEGATVRLSFNVASLTAGTGLSGKLLRNGTTYALTNSTVGEVLTMASTTNTLPVGKYKFVLTWYTIATDEPIEQHTAELEIVAEQ